MTDKISAIFQMVAGNNKLSDYANQLIRCENVEGVIPSDGDFVCDVIIKTDQKMPNSVHNPTYDNIIPIIQLSQNWYKLDLERPIDINSMYRLEFVTSLPTPNITYVNYTLVHGRAKPNFPPNILNLPHIENPYILNLGDIPQSFPPVCMTDISWETFTLDNFVISCNGIKFVDTTDDPDWKIAAEFISGKKSYHLGNCLDLTRAVEWDIKVS